MKKIITLLLCAISLTMLSAQKNADLSLDYLETQQNKAIEKENYDAAAKYKKAITLKSELKNAVANEDWDKAAEIKSELNDINFNGSSRNSDYSDNDGLRSSSDRDFMDGGFFLDGILGAGLYRVNGVSSQPNFEMGFQLGTKWHFGESDYYRPGIQLTWFRMGFSKSPSDIDFSVHIYPFNVGYASVIGFSDELGLEVNVNFGGGFNFILEQFPYDVDIQVGFHVNPNVKFRFGSFAVGVDVSMLNGPVVTDTYSSWATSNMYSITIGGKF
jgi:hypothetical protein